MFMLRAACIAALLFPLTAPGQALINGVPPGMTPEVVEQRIQNAVPPVCTTPPAPDAMVATVGSAAPCVPRADSARQTLIPPSSTVTAADGSFAGTWQSTLPAVPTRGSASIFGNATPYHCQIATVTAEGYTGRCWALVPTTLPSVPAALLGLVVSPVANPASGLTVHVFARY